MTLAPDRPLPPGKVPSSVLGPLIARYATPDASVIVGPGIGRDAAVIAVGDRVIVVKTDPITFPTEDAGRYLVNVNANDIACMGATPRWLLVTALLPEKTTTPRLIEESFASLSAAAFELGIVLVGGHSEITLGLDRLILVGQMIGEAAPDELIDPSRAQPGDAVIMCNQIAIEGTSILGRQAAGFLGSVDLGVIERAANLIRDPGISVVPAAHALRSSGANLHALHDPTEGGLMTALAELADAAGTGIEVWEDAIAILDETRVICDALGLDPFGLIASGALLAVLPDQEADKAMRAVHDAGLPAARIGTLLRDPSERVVLRNGVAAPLPTFATDEIARFFSAN